MDFVALDFETANYSRSSVCEVGIAVVRSGEVVETLSRLVRPKDNWFHPMNVQIHGIDADKVREEPEFDQVWHDIRHLFEEGNVVAHNASFDISVLRHVLMQYDLPFPSFSYTCSLMLARHAWQGLHSYGLGALSHQFNIALRHHAAESDALACAMLLLKMAKENQIASFERLEDHFEIQIGKLYPGGYIPSGKLKKSRRKAADVCQPVDLSKLDKNHPLYGKYVVFTGALRAMSRSEAQRAVTEKGGHYTNSVNRQTDFLVLGQKTFQQLASGLKSGKVRQAEQSAAARKPIAFLSEQQFLELLQTVGS